MLFVFTISKLVQVKVFSHQTEKVFKDYIVDAPWEDLEQDCHLGRTINRWVMGEYQHLYC